MIKTTKGEPVQIEIGFFDFFSQELEEAAL
jgi:hypothetical protein